MFFILFLVNFIILIPTHFLSPENTIAVTLLVIVVDVLYLILHAILKINAKNIIIIISLALIIRVVLLLLNQLFGIGFPHDGMDTEFYHERAKNILLNISEGNFGTLYPLVLGSIYVLTDDNRLYGQFFNIILFYISFFYMNRMFVMLNLQKNVHLILISVFAFFPQSLIFSVILLRESMIVFLVTMAVYYVLKYIKNDGILNVLISLVYILLATAAHSGLVLLLFPLIIIITLYSPKTKGFNFSTGNLFRTILFVSVTSVILFLFNEILLSKFINLEVYEDTYTRLNLSSGDSAYLSSIVISSFIDIIIYSPLKSLYLYISPVPFDWRSILDVFTFIADSSLYMYAIYLIFTNFKIVFKNPFGLFLLLTIVLFGIIFGYGTNTAGTAIRHRFKIIGVIVLIIGLIKGVKKNEDINNR